MFIRRAFAGFGLIAALAIATSLSAKESASSRLAFPPALVEADHIKAEELLTSAQKLLPKGGYLGPLLDARYAVIDHDWLERQFVPFYRDALATLRIHTDRGGEGADCDDFGLFLRQMIGLAGVVARSGAPAAAQVVVFQGRAFSGVGRTRERHAVGLFLTQKGWFVLEPQNAAELVPVERYANRRGIQYITFH